MATKPDTKAETLPLKCATPTGWAEDALGRPLALLNDHAHLEKKAATTALELLHRWPEPNPPENWVRALTVLARDEVDHLAIVCRLLARRGGRLTKHHRNGYASMLHRHVRLGEGRAELVDRLMTAALIEARSCERFELLAAVCEDEELRDLYRELVAADFGHYRAYLDLARRVETVQAVADRWEELLDAEAAIIRRQPPGPRIHSWPDEGNR